MNLPWMKREILRNREDESGGGAVFFEDEGVSVGNDPAPADDRTSKLESRLDKLASSLEGFMNNQREEKQRNDASQIERRIDAAIAAQTKKLDEAEDALAEAYDDGDGRAIAKAQRAVSEQAAVVERVKAQAEQYRNDLKANERRDGGTRSGGSDDDLDTTNLDNWKQKHASWYGVDKEMTKYAHELDAQIRSNGVLASGSKEYFEAIDRQMRQKFPDQFQGTPPTGGSSRGGGQPTSGGRQRIPASVAEGYRRMGINVDDPEVAKRMVANRQKAVQKGWLSEQPATGRVFTR